MRTFLAILMILFAVAGLLATACGAVFIQYGAISLIGIIPGIALILLARYIWSRNFREKSSGEQDKPEEESSREGPRQP